MLNNPLHISFYKSKSKDKNKPIEFHWWLREDALQLDNLVQIGMKCLINK